MRSRSVSVVSSNDRHCADITSSVDSRCVRSHQLQSPTNGTILRSSLSARDLEGELDRKGDTRNESPMMTDEHHVADISSGHNSAQDRDSSCLGLQADLICGRAQTTRPSLPQTTRHAKSEPMVNSSDELFSSSGVSGVLFTSASSCPTDQWYAANDARRRSISLSQAGTLFVCVDDEDEEDSHDGTLDHSNHENRRVDESRHEACEQPRETPPLLRRGAPDLEFGRGTRPSTPTSQLSPPLPRLLIQNSVSRLRELREKLSVNVETATTNRKAHVDECDYWYSGERSVLKRGGRAHLAAGVEERGGGSAHSTTCNSVAGSPLGSRGGEFEVEEPTKRVNLETLGSGRDDGYDECVLLQKAEEEYRMAQQAILSSCSQQRQVAATCVLLEKELGENRELVYESSTESDCCEKTLEEVVMGKEEEKGKKRSREAKGDNSKERRARKGVRSEKRKVDEKVGGEAQEKPDRKKNFFVFYTRADVPYATISAPPTGPYSSPQRQIKEEDRKPPIPKFPIELTHVIEERVLDDKRILTRTTRKPKSQRRVVSVRVASNESHAGDPKDHEKTLTNTVSSNRDGEEEEVLENRESIAECVAAPPIEYRAESRSYPREEKEIETRRDSSLSRRVLAETLSRVFTRIALSHQSGGNIATVSGKESSRRLRETKGKAEAAAESAESESFESENAGTALSDGSLVEGFGSDCDKYHSSGAARLLEMAQYFREGRSELSFGDVDAEVDTATFLSSEHSLPQLVTAATEWTQEHAAYHDACVDERSRFAYYQRANGGRSRLDQSSSRRPASPRHLAALNKDDEHWWSRQEAKCVAAGGAHLMKAILLGLGGTNVGLTVENTL